MFSRLVSVKCMLFAEFASCSPRCVAKVSYKLHYAVDMQVTNRLFTVAAAKLACQFIAYLLFKFIRIHSSSHLWLVDIDIISRLIVFGNLVHVKPDSHPFWTLPSVEHPSINFEYFFQDWLQAECSCRASISSVEPPAIFWPKRIFWRSSSLKSPSNMKAAVSPDEELNLIIIEHVFVS